LGSSAKVATMKPNPNAAANDTRLICVYTYDLDDERDCLRVRQALRELGVRACRRAHRATEVGEAVRRRIPRLSVSTAAVRNAAWRQPHCLQGRKCERKIIAIHRRRASAGIRCSSLNHLEKLMETVVYGAPEILGSFAAHDILGSADGLASGSVIYVDAVR
jgi:hypothetical protein